MTTPINTSMNPIEWLILLTLAVIWGGSFFFVGVAVSELPPLTIVLLRVGIAAIVLWIVVHLVGQRMPKEWIIWRRFLIMGLLNNAIPFSLIVWGQTQITVGLASILNATTPIFAVLVAAVALADERINLMKLIGVLIGFVGVVTIIGIPISQNTGGNDSHLLAEAAVIAAALCYALAGAYGRRFKAMPVTPMVIASGQVTASALLLIPIVLLTEGLTNFAIISASTWSAIFALAVISTAFAYILYFKLLATAGATNSMLVTLLVPVSAILLGATFLDESLAFRHYAGMGLIALGLLAIDGRIIRRLADHQR